MDEIERLTDGYYKPVVGVELKGFMHRQLKRERQNPHGDWRLARKNNVIIDFHRSLGQKTEKTFKSY